VTQSFQQQVNQPQGKPGPVSDASSTKLPIQETLGSTNIKAGWMSFAEAGVQIPLWNRNQGNIEAAKVELDRAHHDVTQTQFFTRNRAEPYAQQYQTARFTAERYRTEMLPRAHRAYQLAVTKYQQRCKPIRMY
jgi:cobalt-zinc-cadmium efflux system outer membrane protein